MKDNEKFCGLCLKFKGEEAPQSVQNFGKNLFFNEDGTPRTDVDPMLQLTYAFSSMAGREYGQRTCSIRGTSSGASPCVKPQEFQERSPEDQISTS